MEAKNRFLDVVVAHGRESDSDLSDFESVTIPYPRGPHLSDDEQRTRRSPCLRRKQPTGKEKTSSRGMHRQSTLANSLENFYDQRVAPGLARKQACEDIAFTVTYKILRKVHTVDERFRGTNLVPHGITYDGLKAGKPIFFEMLLSLSLDRKDTLVVAKDGDSPYVRIKPMSGETWKDCMTRNGFILASKVQSVLRKYVKQAVHVIRKYVSQGKTEKYPSSLKSLFIEGATGVHLIINRDIHVHVLPAFCIPDIRSDYKRRDCPSSSHVVCCSKTDITDKNAATLFTDSQETQGTDDVHCVETAWRVSFYVAEKNKIRALGDGCRIKLLRILTELRDNEEALNPISSYHLKTLLFYICDEIPDSKDWDATNLDQRFLDLLRKLREFILRKSMPHYFLKDSDFPSFNLCEGIIESALQEMAEFIDGMIENPLPYLSNERERQRGDLWPWESDFEPILGN